MARLRELGIRPIVGLLHHGSGPRYTDLLDPAFPALLAHFAKHVAQRYAEVKDWSPVNEPLTTARFSGLYGHWHPHGHDERTFVRALLNEASGIVSAMEAHSSSGSRARLIQTEDVGETQSSDRVSNIRRNLKMNAAGSLSICSPESSGGKAL